MARRRQTDQIVDTCWRVFAALLLAVFADSAFAAGPQCQALFGVKPNVVQTAINYSYRENPRWDDRASLDSFYNYKVVFLGKPRRGTRELLDLIAETAIEHGDQEIAKLPVHDQILTYEEDVYGIPEELRQYVKSLRKINGEVYNDLFNITANIGVYRRLFGAKADLEEIFPTEMRAMILDPNVSGAIRASELFRRLAANLSTAEKPNKVRQAMADILYRIGFLNPETLRLLQSNTGTDVLKGLKRLEADRESLISDLEKNGLKASVKDAQELLPRGLGKRDLIAEMLPKLKELTKTVANLTGTVKKSMRVRALSFAESAFRGDLGNDCSTNEYCKLAFHPALLYFTLTDEFGFSSSQVTIVLGSAPGHAKLAMLDKVQNVPPEFVPPMIEAIRRSLEKEGYELGYPNDDTYGSSNFPHIRTGLFELYGGSQDVIKGFKPLESKVEIDSTGYSRMDENHPLALIRLTPKIEKQIKNFKIKEGRRYGDSTSDADMPPPAELIEQITASHPEKATAILVRMPKANRDEVIERQIIRTSAEVGQPFSTRTLALRQAIPYFTDHEDTNMSSAYVARLRSSWTPQELKAFFSDAQNAPMLNKALIFGRDDALIALAHEYGFQARSLRIISWDVILQRHDVTSITKFGGDLALVRNVYGGNTLTEAARSHGGKSAEWALALMTSGSLEEPGAFGFTPLMAAIRSGQSSLVDRLIEKGAKLETKAYENGETALHVAVYFNQMSIAMDLLDEGADAKALNNHGSTLAHQIVRSFDIKSGDLERWFTLVKNRGVDLNAKNNHGETPLDLARRLGKKAVIDELEKALRGRGY